MQTISLELIGKKIREERERHGWAQKDLAEQLYVDTEYNEPYGKRNKYWKSREARAGSEFSECRCNGIDSCWD